jgi:hypothetical protein
MTASVPPDHNSDIKFDHNVQRLDKWLHSRFESIPVLDLLTKATGLTSFVVCCLYQSEVDETMKKLTSHPGVVGYLIINADGIPIRSS